MKSDQPQMKEHSVNSLDNFICGWYLSDDTVSDRLIAYFNSDERTKKEGMVGNKIVDKTAKDSLEVGVTNLEDIEYYIFNLQNCVEEYVKKYSFCAETERWGLSEIMNIQYYPPGGGFHKWHTERTTLKFSARHLVFMTYLNDITDAGETEFYYQKIKIKPEKGLTLIWPSDWTFTHRGIPSLTQEKYIVTGWLSFLNNKLD